MERLIKASRLIVLGLLVLPLLTAPAMAAHVFHAEITGEQEVVPSGSTAFGIDPRIDTGVVIGVNKDDCYRI